MICLKKLLFVWIVILGATFTSACSSVAIQTESGTTDNPAIFFEDVTTLANHSDAQDLLVVLDIDNTLLAMEQGLGADQWYEWQKQQSTAGPCDQRVVSDRLAVQGALYFASAMRPTHPDMATMVRDIQEAGIPVIALTSRGKEFRLQTFRELRRNGFDFRRSAIGPDQGWDENFIPDGGTRPARYEDPARSRSLLPPRFAQR